MPKVESEYTIESLYIDRLEELGYTYVDLKNYDDVCKNFREQFCRLNSKALLEWKGVPELSDSEYERVMIRLDNHTIYESAFNTFFQKCNLELQNEQLF